MNKTLYCPWCDKYLPEPWTWCPLCSAQTIYIKSWENKTKEEKKEWLEKFPKIEPPRPILKKEKDIRRIEKFNTEIRKELAEEEARKQYTPKCPTCGCPDLDKIGAGEKAVSAAVFGLFSKKIHKQFRCKNCGYEW